MPSIGANIGLSVAAGLSDRRLDPYLSCHFVVEIEGILAGGFSDCTGLQVETETFEYREGGLNEYVHRFAGATRHPLLVLKHGVSLIDGLWGWHQDVVSGRIQRRNGTIYLLADSRPVRWWNFHEALPLKWSGPELQASASAVAFESLEIGHRGLSRPLQSTLSQDVAGELDLTARGLGSFF
jgi:phage tail-like protein